MSITSEHHPTEPGQLFCVDLWRHEDAVSLSVVFLGWAWCWSIKT